MIQDKVQSDPVLQADIMAIDALFKRIAERGRKIRTQNKTTQSDFIAKEVMKNTEQSKSKRGNK